MRLLAVLPLLLLLPLPATASEFYLASIAFRPANDGASYSIDQGGLGCLRVKKGAGFFLAVLPENAGAVEEVTALVEDANPDALALLALVRRRAGSFDVIGTTPPSTGEGGIESLRLLPAEPVAGDSSSALLLQVLLSGPDVCLHGVRVRLR